MWYHWGMKTIPREQRKVNTHTNSRYLRELRQNISLSEVQKSVLMGALMGDGCIIPTASGKNYRLQVEQSNKQKEYLFWKYEVFKEFVITSPKYIAPSDSWRFRTISHKEFIWLRNVFYRNGKKILPKSLDFLLNSLVLAVWFMDDGGRVGSGCLLNIQNFTDSEAFRLQEFFRKRLKIPATLHRNKGKFRLYIPAYYQSRWKDYLGCNFRSEFGYKLSLTRRDLTRKGRIANLKKLL